jgi:beta-lactamase class C
MSGQRTRPGGRQPKPPDEACWCMRSNIKYTLIAVLCVSAAVPIAGNAANDERGKVGSMVAQTIEPLMRQYAIPGMAVGIVIKGEGYVYDYGVASKAGRPVTRNTLFEIGSISKTFTATLAAYAQVRGKLSLSDPASHYLPALRDSSFDTVSLLNLGTHTPGGMPLQVPEDITNNDQLMAYFHAWKPSFAPGTYRTYSNPSIGLLGMIAAKSMHEDFVALMQNQLLPALGLKNTYLNVPVAQSQNYAQGYSSTDAPIRMAPGILGFEAYGIKTTADDLLRFVKANMRLLAIDPDWQRAIANTHTGYYRVEGMTQDLIWEQYPYPVELDTLLAGNSAKIIFEANPATKLEPPLPPQEDALINKTGSTNGFAAYVAFVPGKKIGIVMLANKSYPIDARVTAAYKILTRVGGL